LINNTTKQERNLGILNSLKKPPWLH